MHIITKEILSFSSNMSSPIPLFNKDFLIFDIETTGFSREHAIIYMIGCIYKKDKGYEYCNLFASDPSKEPELIRHFFDMLKDFNCLIHFNGNNFDIPFLLARASKHHIKEGLSSLESIDLYDLLRPFRKCLNFPNLKLDTLQYEFGFTRKDASTGGDLIQIYQGYVRKPYKPYYELMLLHNKEDVEGMIPLLSLIDVFILIENFILKGNFKLMSINKTNSTIEITYALPFKIKINLALFYRDCEFTFVSGTHTAKLILPLSQGKKKRFFENYKDYMYLPEKDEIIHKSIANFIAPHKKVKTKKSTCYISHSDTFIPVFSLNNIAQPFKDNFKSKEYYTILNSDLDTSFFKQQLIGFLKNCKKS